jgi:hypothetical protein
MSVAFRTSPVSRAVVSDGALAQVVVSVANQVDEDARRRDSSTSSGTSELLADEYVESLHQRAAGGQAILLHSAEGLIRNAIAAGVVAESYAIESYIEAQVARAEKHGDVQGALMAMRLQAMVQERRGGLMSLSATRVKERAGW